MFTFINTFTLNTNILNTKNLKYNIYLMFVSMVVSIYSWIRYNSTAEK